MAVIHPLCSVEFGCSATILPHLVCWRLVPSPLQAAALGLTGPDRCNVWQQLVARHWAEGRCLGLADDAPLLPTLVAAQSTPCRWFVADGWPAHAEAPPVDVEAPVAALAALLSGWEAMTTHGRLAFDAALVTPLPEFAHAYQSWQVLDARFWPGLRWVAPGGPERVDSVGDAVDASDCLEIGWGVVRCVPTLFAQPAVAGQPAGTWLLDPVLNAFNEVPLVIVCLPDGARCIVWRPWLTCRGGRGWGIVSWVRHWPMHWLRSLPAWFAPPGRPKVWLAWPSA